MDKVGCLKLTYQQGQGLEESTIFFKAGTDEKEAPVKKRHDYYPFGLTFNSYQRSTALPNKYLYNGIERQTDLDLGWDLAEFRAYDPALGRFIQIDPVIKSHESPYAWNTNNPILYSDPSGADSTQRANAIARAQEYVNQNTGDTYEFGAKGEPGANVDCSGVTSNCVTTAGEPDPISTGTGGGVSRTAANTQTIDGSDIEAGSLVIMNGETHIGIVTSVERDSEGNITNLVIIDSGGTAGSGTSGPRSTNLIADGVANSNFSIDGYRKWDTTPDAARPSNTQSSATERSRVPSSQVPSWAKNNIIGAHLYFIFTGIDPGSGIKY